MPGMKGIYRINPALLGGIIWIAINMVNIGFITCTSLTRINDIDFVTVSQLFIVGF